MPRKMRDSGVEWIGAIPEGWRVSSIKHHYEIILGKMLASEQQNDTDTLEKYFCAANVHFDGGADATSLKEMWFSVDEKRSYKVESGDLLVVEGGAGAGGAAVVQSLPFDAYVQNSILIVRGKNAAANAYAGYLLEVLVKSGYVDYVSNKATIPHFTKEKVGKAQGYVWAATRLGGAAAPFIVLPIIANQGWRFMFYLLGAIGIVWSLIWVMTYRDNEAPKHQLQTKVQIPWGTIVRSGQFWLICSMYFFYAFGSWFFFTWFPEFMKAGRGFSADELKYAVAIPFLMSMCGNIAGGHLTDRLTQKYGIKVGRKALGSTCLAVSALCMVLAAFIPGKIAVFIFLSLCFGIFDLMLPSAWALCIDLGKQFAGSVSGAMNTFGNFGGFCCSLMFGYLLKSTGNYNLPLYMIGGTLFISALLFAFINPTKPIIKEK